MVVGLGPQLGHWARASDLVYGLSITIEAYCLEKEGEYSYITIIHIEKWNKK
jgi:hypothetical protein